MSCPSVGIRGISYYIGDIVPIDELPCMVADSELLSRFRHAGFQYFSRSPISLAEQAILVGKKTMLKCGMSAEQIDAVVIGTSELRDWHAFPEGLSKDILRGIGLNKIPVTGVTLAGCANLASSMRMARNMIVADGYRNVLVIETNQVRGNLERPVGTGTATEPATVFSDGAASCLVTSGDADFKILAMDQIAFLLSQDEPNGGSIFMKNIAGFRHVVDRALAVAGLTRKQIDCFLFANMNPMLYRHTMCLLGFMNVKSFRDNVYRYAHLWSADILVNLMGFCEKESPPPGTRFLMACQGNSYYSAIICEKQ